MGKPAKMIVTGATGVVGSAVVEYMKREHPEVEVVPFGYAPFSLQRLHDALADGNTTYFVNAAGIGGDKDCEERPWECFEANTNGVLNQLEIIRKYSSLTRWIGFGTIYEDTHKTPYSATKRAMRETVETYRKTYGLYAVIAKLGFTESCKRPATMLSRKITSGVARIAKAIKAEESFDILQLRDVDQTFAFTWVDDVADGIWKMLNLDNNPRDLPLVSWQRPSISLFVQLAFSQVGINGAWTVGRDGYELFYSGDKVLVHANQIHSVFCDPIVYPDMSGLNWRVKVSFEELVKRLMACEMEAKS